MFTIKSLLTPVLLSFFIYFEYFGITNLFMNTLVGLLAIYTLFSLSKKELFIVGFFTGILWFWWIGYSFIYYDLVYLIPLVVIGIGVIYGLLFFILGFFEHILLKISYILLLTYIEPFSFNWFKLELLFINSYLGISKIEFFCILLITSLLILLKNKNKFYIAIFLYLSGILVLILFNYQEKNIVKTNNLKIYLKETNINQKIKWDKKYINTILIENINSIDNAIADNYDLIIFPETAYPLVLNHNIEIHDILIKKSKKISIVLGSLYEKDNLYYNSTYLFQEGTMKVAHKVVLVPFGEAVPLPAKIRDFINNMFYNGAKDYETAKSPTTFNIKGVKFRNAICYEATTDTIYEDLDTNFVISTSNNGWFVPSVQPTLQRLLLKYYAKKYNLLIYNVTNKSKSGIIQ